MAKITAGINGPFSGKVGPVVGCTWKGIPYMRSLPKKRTSKPSSAELANRKRFADAQAWLKPLTGFVRAGFKGFSPTVEGFVAAKSYLLKNAIEGEYPNYLINLEKMKLSYGNLPVAKNPSVSWEPQMGEMVFTWDTSTVKGTSPRDQVMMLAYCVELGRAVFITTGVFRKTGTDELSLPDNFRGKHVEVYIAFLAADRSRQSDSVYLGSVLCGE
jgi:hypothetical protein